ncbi:MAG: alpha/beta hydrolase-fold protein [Bacteroidota bacterium]
MKNVTLLFCLLMLFCFDAKSQDNKASSDIIGSISASTNIRGAKYPLILPNHHVMFRIKAPDAQKVQIDLGKKYDLIKGDDGFWSITTDSISEGFHYYSLLIDGMATADPASESFYGMGRMASGIEIPFAAGEYYAEKDVPHGDIRIKKYYSTVAKSWRRVYLYTPPGYDANIGEKYPVLYILHGGGEDERGWATQGRTDMIMDNLIAGKMAKPMLVVMPDANLGAGAFGEDGLKAFEAEMKQCIIPFIENNYRVKNTSANRALAGLSMGGINTLYTGVYNINYFSYLGVFSSGWIVPMQDGIANAQYAYMKQNGPKINSNLKLFWISEGGKEDIAYKNGQIMLAKFDELNIHYTYSEYPGGHTWPVWRNDLYHFAPLLFK